MQRTATCTCGYISITVGSEPASVCACHCFDCQKMTGSVFGVSAYFDTKQIIASAGNPKVFKKSAGDGQWLRRCFCSHCGTTVYWQYDNHPEKIGIAAGCFADPSFPEPSSAVWTGHKHTWVSIPEHWKIHSP